MKNIIFQQQNSVFLKIKNEAYKFLDNSKFPIVVKADGLAAGKGVYICEELEKAKVLSMKFLMENLEKQEIF